MKPYYCENCAFFDELKNEQPCCYCVDGINFVGLEKGENDNEHLAVLLSEAKAKVAREIFEEIEKNIIALGSTRLYGGIKWDVLAELKKKYTEGNQEPQIKKRCPDCKYFVGCETACGGVPCDLYDEGDEK